MIYNQQDLYFKIVDILYHAGIKNICISPGLRNSIPTLSFIKYKKFNCYSILDERSSAYFALGLSLKQKNPTILLCTSGTAIANYFPAIIESSQNRIPLIILTADRPENLYNTGTNQTINQKNIYGEFVRSHININTNSKINDTLNKIEYAIQLAFGNDYTNNKKTIPGPIHINMHLQDVSNNLNFKKINYSKKKFHIIKSSYQKINIDNYDRPLIVAGRINKSLNAKMITKLSNHLKAPILADPLSQIRFNNKNILGLYDFYIHNLQINPDIIIRIGQKPTSKKLCDKLKEWKDHTILIDSYGRFNDDVRKVVKVNEEDFIKDIIQKTKPKVSNAKFYDYLLNLEDETAKNINNKSEKWSELLITKKILSSMDTNENLFISNSMPIRYLDMIEPNYLKININIYSNRGASGIDGIISTALGVAKSSKKRTLLLIGDLSFIHDLNSLIIAKKYNINLTIVIINNNGGGIFSLLPISNLIEKNLFKEYWTTPQNLDFKKIANLYDIDYTLAKSTQELINSLSVLKHNRKLNILETKININENKKILENYI